MVYLCLGRINLSLPTQRRGEGRPFEVSQAAGQDAGSRFAEVGGRMSSDRVDRTALRGWPRRAFGPCAYQPTGARSFRVWSYRSDAEPQGGAVGWDGPSAFPSSFRPPARRPGPVRRCRAGGAWAQGVWWRWSVQPILATSGQSAPRAAASCRAGRRGLPARIPVPAGRGLLRRD
jgi:hypothetical protein